MFLRLHMVFQDKGFSLFRKKKTKKQKQTKKAKLVITGLETRPHAQVSVKLNRQTQVLEFLLHLFIKSVNQSINQSTFIL